MIVSQRIKVFTIGPTRYRDNAMRCLMILLIGGTIAIPRVFRLDSFEGWHAVTPFLVHICIVVVLAVVADAFLRVWLLIRGRMLYLLPHGIFGQSVALSRGHVNAVCFEPKTGTVTFMRIDGDCLNCAPLGIRSEIAFRKLRIRLINVAMYLDVPFFNDGRVEGIEVLAKETSALPVIIKEREQRSYWLALRISVATTAVLIFVDSAIERQLLWMISCAVVGVILIAFIRHLENRYR